MPRVFVGTIGIKVKVSTGVDLSGTPDVKLIISKPDGRKTEWSVSVEAPAEAGIVSKILSSTDLNVEGLWKVQVKVIKGEQTLYGDIASFMVYKKLNE